MTTLEQVEKLRSMANVSYEDAKMALDETDGDLLQAVINLEKQGKINAPAGGGYYSSERTGDAQSGASYQANHSHQNQHHHNGSGRHKEKFGNHLKHIGSLCLSVLRWGNRNTFEIFRNNESKASIPVTALALLLIFLFWVTLPLLIIGLFFGFRYRFSGPELSGSTGSSMNNVMDSAADAAEDLRNSMDSPKH